VRDPKGMARSTERGNEISPASRTTRTKATTSPSDDAGKRPCGTQEGVRRRKKDGKTAMDVEKTPGMLEHRQGQLRTTPVIGVGNSRKARRKSRG